MIKRERKSRFIGKDRDVTITLGDGTVYVNGERLLQEPERPKLNNPPIVFEIKKTRSSGEWGRENTWNNESVLLRDYWAGWRFDRIVVLLKNLSVTNHALSDAFIASRASVCSHGVFTALIALNHIAIMSGLLSGREEKFNFSRREFDPLNNGFELKGISSFKMELNDRFYYRPSSVCDWVGLSSNSYNDVYGDGDLRLDSESIVK